MAVFRRYIEEAWNAGDVLVLNELLTEDHVRHEPGVPDVEGIEGIRIYITAFREAFPDARFTIADIGADGDRVWARTVATGTHTGPLRLEDGTIIPPTGNPLNLEAMTIARFEEGKIAELWHQADVLGIFRQLGVVPAVGELVTEAQNTEIARRVFEDLLNGANLDSVEALYGPGFSRFFMPNSEGSMMVSADNWRVTYQWMHEAMPDLQVTVERVFVENDVVVVHYTAQGTLEGGLSNTPSGNRLPATGELETWDGVILFRVEDGLIVEEWWYWDNPVYATVDYCE